MPAANANGGESTPLAARMMPTKKRFFAITIQAWQAIPGRVQERFVMSDRFCLWAFGALCQSESPKRAGSAIQGRTGAPNQGQVATNFEAFNAGLRDCSDAKRLA